MNNLTSSVLYPYLDFLWLPIALLAVKPYQRWLAALFVVTCLGSLRLQNDLMDRLGFPNGVLPLFQSTAQHRGEVAYNILIGLFLLLAHFSPKTRGVIFLAAALVVYIFALCVSMLVMAL